MKKVDLRKNVVHKKEKHYALGWTNIRWFFGEILKIYSSQPSFFSKKRIESGVAFILGQVGMMVYFFYKYPNLTMMEMLSWAAVEFAIAGYITNQIQKQKKESSTEQSAEPESDPNQGGQPS